MQQRDEDSTLRLYQAALRLRPGFSGPLTWLDSTDGVLDFERAGVRCVVNASAGPVPLPTGQPTLASAPVTDELPPDTAVWYVTG